MGCAMCGSCELVALGDLGGGTWVRCRACGWTYCAEIDGEEVEARLNDEDSA